MGPVEAWYYINIASIYVIPTIRIRLAQIKSALFLAHRSGDVIGKFKLILRTQSGEALSEKSPPPYPTV